MALVSKDYFKGITRKKVIPENVYGYWVTDNGEGRWVFHKFPADLGSHMAMPWYSIVTESGVWASDRTFESILNQKMPDSPDAHLKYWIEIKGGVKCLTLKDIPSSEQS